MRISHAPEMEDIQRLLRDRRGKYFKDVRDRAAYMHITGTYPSHLREHFTRVLGLISVMSNRATSLDHRLGTLKIDGQIREQLDLDRHPMVMKAKEYIKEGYRIELSLGSNRRKPYTKIWLFRGLSKLTIQIDGSVLDHWKGEGEQPTPRAR